MSQVASWTAVAKSLPTEDGPYLVYCPSADRNKPLVSKAWYSPKHGWSLLERYWADGITHWMPMPKPPIVE